MQNKANFLNDKTNATFFAAKVYENKPPLGDSKKTNPNKPNSPAPNHQLSIINNQSQSPPPNLLSLASAI